MASNRDRARRGRKGVSSPGGAQLVTEPLESPVAEQLHRITKSSDGSTSQIPDAGTTSQIFEIGQAIAPVLPLERLLLLAEQNPIHSACLEAVASDATGKGWKLGIKRGVSATDVTEEENRAKAEELEDWLEEITPDSTFQEMLDQAAWEWRATGWAIWEVARKNGDPTAEIESMYPLPGHTLRATKDKNVYMQERGSETIYFALFGCGKKLDAKTGKFGETENVANEVIVFKKYSPRSTRYGLPRWISAIPTIAELTAIREFNVAWFFSGGQSDRLHHVIANDSTVSEAIGKSIKDQAEDSKGRGHTALVTYGTEDTKVDTTILSKKEGDRDGQFTNRRDDLAKEVLMAHQVPPYRIGWAEIGALGGSSAKEMLRAYKAGAVDPTQELLESRLKRAIFNPKMGGFDLGKFVFVLDDVDWDQLEQDIKLVAMAVDKGVITPNEGRAHLGWEQTDDPAANKLYYMGVPLDSLPTMGGNTDTKDDRATAAQDQVQEAVTKAREAFSAAISARAEVERARGEEKLSEALLALDEGVQAALAEQEAPEG